MAKDRTSSWQGRAIRNGIAAIVAFGAWVLLDFIDFRFLSDGPVEAGFFLSLPIALLGLGVPPFFFWLANRHEFAGHPQQLIRVLGVTFSLTVIFYAAAFLPLLAVHMKLGGPL